MIELTEAAPNILVMTVKDKLTGDDIDAVVAKLKAMLAEYEKIGMVANFQDYVGGTTSHLHFDVQVFTRDGWLWVNPYVTLISAYERLIGGHGREYVPPSPDKPAMAHAEPAESQTTDALSR